jgi:hypothetical protein
MHITSRLFVAALLAVGLVGVLPAVTASAATTYKVTWIDSEDAVTTMTYACSGGIQTYYGENVLEVSANGCGDRIWMHQYTDGDGNSYCINPNAITYGFSNTYGDFEQVEPTGNQADCDATTEIDPIWSSDDDIQEYCIDGHTFRVYIGYGEYAFVLKIVNLCNVRIWIHDSAGDALACVSPGGYPPASTYVWNGVSQNATEYQISGNQAPCSAG